MATLVQPRAPAPTTTPEPQPRAPTVAPTEQSRAPAAAQTEQARAPAAAQTERPRAPAAAPKVVEQPREAPAAVETKKAATTTRTAADQQLSSGTNGSLSPAGAVRNVKAETMAEAHRERVASEAHTYLQSESRKAEAHAASAQSRVDQKRMKDEAKAIEDRKLEEARAEQIIRAAEVKADKIMATAGEEVVRIKANANEEAEVLIADSNSQAEREKAQIEETKKRELAELQDKVEELLAAGTLPNIGKEKRTVGAKIRDTLVCNHGVSKNVVVEELLATMALKSASLDFVLCVENICSDEDKFTTIARGMNVRLPKYVLVNLVDIFVTKFQEGKKVSLEALKLKRIINLLGTDKKLPFEGAGR